VVPAGRKAEALKREQIEGHLDQIVRITERASHPTFARVRAAVKAEVEAAKALLAPPKVTKKARQKELGED
jgi:hypothetical protein